MNTENNNYKYIKYNDFWQNSLQRIESITKDIEQYLGSLEKKYYDFDDIYKEITKRIGILASIYSGHNNIKGGEYILKLKALLNNYRKQYFHNGIDFKAIHFLNSKINKLREASFNNFPKMNHSYYLDIESLTADNDTIDSDIERYNSLKLSAKYRWITYKRNGSWFITPYDKFRILSSRNAEIKKDNDLKDKLFFEDKYLEITDIFSRLSTGKKENADFYIVIKINNDLTCHTAEKLGRIVMADKNFISPYLKTLKKNKISPGRFRIFGKNHLYLEPSPADIFFDTI